jgi:hypothetical protein
MKKNYYLIVAVLFIICGFFVGTNQAKADNLPSVIINEFSSTSNPEWVELLNTTGSDVSLVGWKLKELTSPSGLAPAETDWVTLSGIISTNGVLVFEVSGANLNNPGDSIGLYDSGSNLIQRITYGTVTGYTVTTGLETAPASGKSSAYIAGSWLTDQTPSKNLLNGTSTTPTFNPSAGEVSSGTTITITSGGADHIYYTTDNTDPATSVTGTTLEYSSPVAVSSAVTIKAITTKSGYNNSSIGSASYTVPSSDPVADAFDTISSTLASNGIVNNMNDVTGSNITSFSGLYFEKRTTASDATTALGRITFNSALDLSSNDTKTFLQNLGTKMDASTAGEIGLDFRGTTDNVSLKGVNATIKFYNLDDLGFVADSTVDEINSKLIALDDEGNVIDKSTLISSGTPPTYFGACEVGGGCYVFTIPVNHFTKYKIDEVGETTPNESGQATLSGDTKEVVITNPTQAVTVSIASGTTDSKINVSEFITGGTGTLPAINIVAANANNTTVAIPASTTVTSADVAWNGVIATPTVTTVTLPETSGETKTLSTAIEIGFTGAKLSFNKAVRILLPNQAGKKVGYVRTGITFTEITNICALDNQATGDALAADGDCKIDVGSDLVIWTKHFTSFATYSTTSSGGSSSGSRTITTEVLTIGDGCAPGNLFSTTTGNACAQEEIVVETYEGCDNRDYGFSTMTGKTCVGNAVPEIAKATIKPAKKITDIEITEVSPDLTTMPAEKELLQNNLTASAGTVSSTINRSSALWALLVIALGSGIGYGTYRVKRNKKLDKVTK